MEWSLLFGKVGSANMDLSSVKLKNPVLFKVQTIFRQ
jgi:hypothetical protein